MTAEARTAALTETRQPTWVRDSIEWPSPATCRTMTEPEAQQHLEHYAAEAVAAQLVVEYHQKRIERFTSICRRIAAVHPKAAAAAERKATR